MSEVMQASPASLTESLKGFAAMCRSGAMDPSDGEMIARKFDAAREEIGRLRDALTKLDDMIVTWAKDKGFPPENSACLRVVRSALQPVT